MSLKEYTLKALAELTNSQLCGNPEYRISGVESLDTAISTDASFLANARYKEIMNTSKAGVICIDCTTTPLEGKNFLISDNPSTCFQKIVELFFPHANENTGFLGVHPTAFIHPTAQLSDNIIIGPYAVIDAHVTIGSGTAIYPFCYIGSHSKVGKNCILHTHVTIRERCTLGDRVLIQPGAVIGSCGFGYSTDAEGRHNKLQQLGAVEPVLSSQKFLKAPKSITSSRLGIM
jgi:UDP-3-O-[3-hydroxymyristoyl] glucosamine N-acyltransferase